MLGYFPLLLWVAVLSVTVGVYDVTLVKVGGIMEQLLFVVTPRLRTAGN